MHLVVVFVYLILCTLYSTYFLFCVLYFVFEPLIGQSLFVYFVFFLLLFVDLFLASVINVCFCYFLSSQKSKQNVVVATIVLPVLPPFLEPFLPSLPFLLSFPFFAIFAIFAIFAKWIGRNFHHLCLTAGRRIRQQRVWGRKLRNELVKRMDSDISTTTKLLYVAYQTLRNL